MSKYSDFLDRYLERCEAWACDKNPEVISAMRIADRLEQEKVTSSVLRQGFKVLEENYDGIDSSRMGIQGFGRAVEEVFRQFLKEEENK